jgi:parallel beta-helix repeat protein
MPRGLGTALALVAAVLLLVPAGDAFASHVRCGDVITQDTTLDSDLVDCPGDGIVIGASDITLDLNGQAISGTGVGTGVRNAGHHRVQTEGGTVSRFRSGVVISGAMENRIERNHLIGNIGSGIVLEGSNGNSVVRNEISSPHEPTGFGIEVGTCCGEAPRSHGNLIVGNSVARQGQGIRVIGSENRVERNRVEDTQDDGIVVNGSDNRLAENLVLNTLYSGRAPFFGVWGISLSTARATRIERNTVSGYYDSIVLSDSTDNLVRRNSLSGQGLTAVKGVYLLTFSDRNRVEENRISATTIGVHTVVHDTLIERNRLTGNFAGLYVDRDSSRTVVRRNYANDNLSEGITIDSEQALVTRNVARGNGGDGIRVAFGPGVVLERNVASDNGRNGISFLFPQGTLVRNTANRNGRLGIEARPGVTDGGGNRARHNGNPLECLNVFCR